MGSVNLKFMEKADFVGTFWGLISMHLQGFFLISRYRMGIHL